MIETKYNDCTESEVKLRSKSNLIALSADLIKGGGLHNQWGQTLEVEEETIPATAKKILEMVCDRVSKLGKG